MEDTIAAVSTAYGEGGIGIIRISGENAKSVLQKIFVPVNNGQIINRKMTYGDIVDPKTQKRIDEVLCVFMQAPKTYTTEDVVEINCHGSVVALKKILSLVLDNGARLAEPGEFTKRAFLNGRLDLSQAEAVIDLIRAKTDRTFEVALDQLEGKFSENIKEIRTKLVDVLVNISVNIDYPDEDIEELTYSNLLTGLTSVHTDIEGLLATADTGKILREGLNIAIIGKPNVGKSSLMNSLLKESRAIVTDIPGTTRDVIEEAITIQGIPVKLIDTAGIRETKDTIEKIGIEKSKDSFNKADLVIFMIDSSVPLEDEDYNIIEYLKDRDSVVILNKTDLGEKVEEPEVRELLPRAKIIKTSLKESIGIELLEKEIVNLVYSGKVKQSDSIMVTNVRHENLLKEAKQAIDDAMAMAQTMEALEVIEIDVNRAYELLGEIVGETVQEDIINELFARFCLGK